ncbi:MAG: CRISPR-associated endoribonuclease Cas6 [Oscillospiraceae bacterium]|nr:CRISPR-associated endoribonuclease Cas6 [Oscillospiraceae bacterium]
MNAIELVFSSEQPMELPIAYHALVQGLLYSVWRETRPFLHDAGFSNGGRGLRLFTFGPLRGRYQVAGRRIRFAAPLRLEVRSPVSGLLEDLCRALPERRDLALGGVPLRLEQITLRDRLLFPSCALIRTCAPIALYRTLPDHRTRYFAPFDPEWLPGLERNLAEKLAVLGSDAPAALELDPLWPSLCKRVLRFKQTYITGYTGKFRLRAAPEAMAALYYAGLGSRNSQGCGMFDILSACPAEGEGAP